MIEINIDSSDYAAALEQLIDKLTHRQPLMRALAGTLADAVEENFAQQGRPAWQGLAHRDGKILQLSGQLAASITPFSDNNTAVVGTHKPYAAIHQFGGKTRPHVIRARHKKALAFGGRVVKQVNHPGSNIPARPFLRLTEQDNEDIVATTHAYFKRVIAD